MRKRAAGKRVWGTAAPAAVAMLLALAGCGSDTEPVTIDAYIDATYSNDQVTNSCIDDIVAAAAAAAVSRGRLYFRSFDGDPLRRRGLTKDFRQEDIPNDFQGTREEDPHLEAEAEEQREEIERLAALPPLVGGSPLMGVLTRSARLRASDQVEGSHHVLICTDGLFTDVNGETSDAELRQLSEPLGSHLKGATVDFIGLAASAPGRGPTTERTRPRVEALLGMLGAHMGIWDVELPDNWQPS